VAKINPVKVRQDADKLEKAGKLDQAIVLFRQIVEDNPRDWNTINKIGDLFAKLNRLKEASGEYAKVADFYARDGFLLKAIAIWKKINKLDPTILEPYLNLADLYGKQGLMMEAKGQYQYVVDEFVKRGRMKEAGDVLKKMAEIDPADLKVRSRLADLYTREGNASKAVDEHVAIAEELNKKGHLAEAVQVLEKGLKIDPKSHRLRLELGRVYLVQKNHERAAHYLEEAVQGSPNDPKILVRLGEAYVGAKKIEEAEAIFKRLLELDPNDQESRVQMARVYLMQGQFDRAFEGFQPIVDKLVERRDGDKAAALLQQILQKNPQHIRTLQKLVDIYRGLQKDQYVVQIYSQLTEAFIKINQFEQAASVLEILVSMEPQNQQHKTKLQFVRTRKSGPVPASAPSPSAPSSSRRLATEDIEMEEEFDLGPAPEVPSTASLRAPAKPAARGAAPGASAPGRPSIELSGPLSGDDSEFVEEHLAEGRVFRKYGLVDKAADQFEAIVARFADNSDARQELRDLYKDKGQPAKAAEHAMALAEIARLKGDPKGAAAYEEEAQQLVPALVPSAPAAPVKRAPVRPAPLPPELEMETEVVEEAEESIAQNDEEVLLEVEEGGLEAPSTGSPVLEEELGRAGDFGNQFVEHDDIDIAVEEEALSEPPVEEELPDLGASEPAEASLDFEAEAPLSFDVDEELTLDEPEPPPPPPPKPKPAPVKIVEPPPAPPRPKPVEPAPAPPKPKPVPVEAAPAPAPPKPKPPAPPPVFPPAAPKPKPVPVPPPAKEVEAAAPVAPGMPSDLQKLLAEVDSYIAVGFADDARELLRDAKKYASHPAVMAKLQELGVEAEEPASLRPAPKPTARPVEPPPPSRPAPKPAPPAPKAKPAPPPPEPEPEPELEMPPVEEEVSASGHEPDFDMPAADDPFAGPSPIAARDSESDDLFGQLGVDVEPAEPEPEPEPEPALDVDLPFGSAVDEDEPLVDEPLPFSESAGIEDEPLVDNSGFDRYAVEEIAAPPDFDSTLPDLSEPELAAPSSSGMSFEDLVGARSNEGNGRAGDVDLSAELGGLFDAQSAVEEPRSGAEGTELGDSGLAEIFKEFKAGVDRQLGKEDYDTRYNLGIAYKEMGLVDEAIAEFQLAAKDEARMLECSSMLGLCFMEKGMPKLAIKWFERGLNAPGRTDEEYLGLRYDLAVAHEAAGDVDAALGLYTDLYGQNANFRDVAEKIRQLGGA
jgi:tetratricopeptide (TPR) repeat protein